MITPIHIIFDSSNILDVGMFYLSVGRQDFFQSCISWSMNFLNNSKLSCMLRVALE